MIAREVDVIRDQLQRNHIALISGTARFVDTHALRLELDGGAEERVTAAEAS